MRRVILFTVLLPGFLFTGAQTPAAKTIVTDSSEIHRTYFTDGKKSGETITLNRQPQLKTFTAYDHQGRVIYQKQYGHMWGSSCVRVTYHPNGGLRSAQYTMQPDGGIQRTDITTYFTPDGKFDHEDDNSWGNDGSPHIKPVIMQTPPPNKPKSEPKTVVECTPVPASKDFYVINATKARLRIVAQYKPIAASPIYKTILPGDTVKIGIYYSSIPVDNPLNYYTLTVKNAPAKGYTFSYKQTAAKVNSGQAIAIMYTRTKGSIRNTPK